MSWPQIPLEDTFGDCLRKAMIGNRIDAVTLAQRTGLHAHDITSWTKDSGVATADEARALAPVLRLRPDRFADRAVDAWAPPPIERPDVSRHEQDSAVQSNGYVFFLENRDAALVDPAGTPAKLLRVLRDGNYRLKYILATHKHDDHCDALAAVAREYPDAQIIMHQLDSHAIGTLASKALPIQDGAALDFGDTKIRMFHTPGHTDGSTSFLFNGTLFTGDMLFAGSVGGAYADKATYDDILNSIRTKMFALADDTVIMPGHGPPSTIGLEKGHNPFFPPEH